MRYKNKKLIYTIFFWIILMVLSGQVFAQPNPWVIEYRFNLVSEDGDIMTCTNLQQEDFSIFNFETISQFPEYDTINKCFMYSEFSWGARLAFCWVRNTDTMNLYFIPVVGFSNPQVKSLSEIAYYSFDSIRFEKGHYKIEYVHPHNDVYDPAWHNKYNNTITTTVNGKGIHYNWSTLKEFEINNWNQEVNTLNTDIIQVCSP